MNIELTILGNQMLKRGDAAAALRCFVESARTTENAAAYHNIGKAYEALGDCCRALVAYREAVRLLTAGHSADTRELFMDSLQRTQKYRHEAKGITVDAIMDVEPAEERVIHGFSFATYKFISPSPGACKAAERCGGIGDFFDHGGNAYNRGALMEALDFMEGAVNYTEVLDTKAEALSLAAAILVQTGNPDRARAYIELACELAPAHPDVVKRRRMLAPYLGE